MRPFRTLGLAGIGLAMVSAQAESQQQHRDDSFSWYIGAQAGVLGFETPRQTRAFVPTFGGNLVVISKRTGLMISVDEAFGSGETTGYTDVNATDGIREVTFEHLRKYAATLTAYPVRGSTQPYFGFGFGLVQVIDPQPGGFFTSPAQAQLAQRLAANKSTDGFVSFLAGLQFKLNGVVAFGQYQIASAPAAGQLLRGASHSLVGGVRFSLGGAKEGIKGGGY
ncbi:MAG: hypothetical protein AB7L66_08645 [Gemmatimonadales bacterium]